jgi:hypothetical protein
MEAKEKAEALIDKFTDLEYPTPTWSNNKETSSYSYNMAKQCAIIAVDEIINLGLLQERTCGFQMINHTHNEYWQEVKKEIELL